MEIVTRSGLAKLLDVSEATTRNLEARGEIVREGVVGNRGVYSVAKALALRARRDAERTQRTKQRKSARA